MKGLTLEACAKINLGLRILGRHSDGYHELVTIFQRISLCDRITLEPVSGEVEYTGPRLTEEPSENLCVKGAEVFRRIFDPNFGVRIRLDKQIPAGAGLGGGSGDAATTLIGMARLFDIPLDDQRLYSAAVAIGADVPFFLSGRSSALGRGRGEILSDSPGLNPEQRILIVWPGFAVSTDWAYGKIDDNLTFTKNSNSIIDCEFSSYSGGLPTAMMTNDFEGPVFATHPELAGARDRLLVEGAVYAGLCGSGSALFGVFDGEAPTRAAALGWNSPWQSFVCRPC